MTAGSHFYKRALLQFGKLHEAGKMLVITLINQKGGAGKSTLARGLLSAASAGNIACGFLDTDKTENLVQWAGRATVAGNWSDGVQAFKTLNPQEAREMIIDLEEEGDLDLFIVDTPGDANELHDQLATVSDLILCPIQPSTSDLSTAIGTANWMYRMRSRVDDPKSLPPFRAAINRVGSKPTKTEAGVMMHARVNKLVGDGIAPPKEKLRFIPRYVQQRDAYRRMDEEGLLDRMIASEKTRKEKFFKNPKHLKDALDEMTAFLDLCLEITGPANG